MKRSYYLTICSALLAFLTALPAARAGAQAVKILDTSCAYQFQRFEITQLLSWGWRCTDEVKEVAQRMSDRGFSSKQYVHAYQIYHDIPGLVPDELETVAALHLVDINPKYYYAVDKQDRISPMEAYNRLHAKRGRPLMIAGISLAVIGAALGAYGVVRLNNTDEFKIGDEGRRVQVSRLNEEPLGAAFAFAGFTSLGAGIVLGAIGIRKLSLRTEDDVLHMLTMKQLKRRRTKVHHFSPDDFYYDLYRPSDMRSGNVEIKAHIDPRHKVFGIGAVVTF